MIADGSTEQTAENLDGGRDRKEKYMPEEFIENGKRVKILTGPRAGKRGTIVKGFSDPEIVRWWNESFANESIAGPGYVIEIGCLRVCEPIDNVQLDESSPENRQQVFEEGMRKSIYEENARSHKVRTNKT